MFIVPRIGYEIIAQSSENDTLIQCKRYLNDQNFQPRLWPSSVVLLTTTEEGHWRG